MREQGELFGGAPDAMDGGAVLSACGRYRYHLWRVWDTARPQVAWVMLNPSKADATVDDLTLKKCMGFARQWGYGGVHIVNLYAWRHKDPEVLASFVAEGGDGVGPENEAHLRAAMERTTLVVCAWGGHPLARALAPSFFAKVPAGVVCECLGRTAEGAPRHPSRLAYATPREPFAAEVERATDTDAQASMQNGRDP